MSSKPNKYRNPNGARSKARFISVREHAIASRGNPKAKNRRLRRAMLRLNLLGQPFLVKTQTFALPKFLIGLSKKEPKKHFSRQTQLAHGA